jgi:hypothetical protein
MRACKFLKSALQIVSDLSLFLKGFLQSHQGIGTNSNKHEVK